MKRKDLLKIDNLYYLKSLVNPLDQLLEVAVGSNKFLATQLDYRTAYSKVLGELKKLFAPKMVRRE